MVSEDKQQSKREILIPVSGAEEKTVSTKKSDKESSVKDEDNPYFDQLQRLQAEFANYRRRIDEERKSLFSIAKSELVSKLLPVLDDLERMIQHQNGDCEINIQGVRLIYQNLKKALSEEGLEEIPAKDEIFDPEIHEAVGVEETDEDRDGIVVEEWQKGYRFGERMIRPSRVKVGRHVQKAGDA